MRFSVKNNAALASNYNYRLQWAELGGATSCEAVTSTNFQNVPTTTASLPVVMTTSALPYFTDGGTTTNLTYGLSDPSDGWSWG
ncbi:unnamed protein product, partial [marine sediment metagenome]